MPHKDEEFQDPQRWKLCPRCGQSTAEDGNFCHQCGVPLIEVACECGRSLNAQDHFCPACGADVIARIRTASSRFVGEAV